MDVLLGNSAPVSVHHADRAAAEGIEGDTSWREGYVRQAVEGEHVTHLRNDEVGALDFLADIRGAWDWHSNQPPSWVAASDSSLAQMLASHYGCEVVDWNEAVFRYLDKAGVAAPGVTGADEAPAVVSSDIEPKGLAQ